MKRKSFFFLIGFFLLAVFLLVAIFFVSAGDRDRLLGFAYSSNIGWLSLNCANPELDGCQNIDYAVNYDKETGKLNGLAWSEHGGWWCFGEKCKDWSYLIGAPDKTIIDARVNSWGLVSGWSAFPNLLKEGFVSLQGDSIESPGEKYACGNCYKLWNNEQESCAFCFASAENGGSGPICENCQNCSGSICQNCSSCYLYGSAIDFSKNILRGWAWGEGKNKENYGWIKFTSDIRESETNLPYWQTVGGDLYSGGNIGALNNSKAGDFGATYLILANGEIINFTSFCQDNRGCFGEEWLKKTEELVFPEKNNNYQSSFGRFDVNGLLAGHYGKVNQIIAESQIPTDLGGEVYYAGNDIFLTTKFFESAQTGKKGAGTLIVKGDLYIRGNIEVSAEEVEQLKRLAVLGIVVLKNDEGMGGNVYIDPAVSQLSANIYAENTIFTGTTGDFKTDIPLRVDGSLVAKRFLFQRRFSSIETPGPAENIVYDGRVLLNPPPGFSDLLKSLPTYK